GDQRRRNALEILAHHGKYLLRVPFRISPGVGEPVGDLWRCRSKRPAAAGSLGSLRWRSRSFFCQARTPSVTRSQKLVHPMTASMPDSRIRSRISSPTQANARVILGFAIL